MVNHDPEDLGMMTMKEVCVNYVRRTTEVGENVQEELIVHLVALMHWQKTWPDLKPLQTVLRVVAHGLHTSQAQGGWMMVYFRVCYGIHGTLRRRARLSSNVQEYLPV